MSLEKFHIGTSGWHYEHWKGPFYPESTTGQQMLEFYVKHLTTVEINNTFYNLPDEDTFLSWRKAVPETFIFCPKASRYITHMKKLKDPAEPLDRFLSRVEILKHKLGPILFQLPPKWNKNLSRLEEFLNTLPDDHRYAFEFRDPDWFGSDTDELMRENNTAFCIYDFEGRQSPLNITADFVYVRLHGPNGAYRGKYSDEALNKWSNIFESWAKRGKEIYCFFDNDEGGYAAQNALKLNAMLSTEPGG